MVGSDELQKRYPIVYTTLVSPRTWDLVYWRWKEGFSSPVDRRQVYRDSKLGKGNEERVPWFTNMSLLKTIDPENDQEQEVVRAASVQLIQDCGRTRC